jgi:hypothetical protein
MGNFDGTVGKIVGEIKAARAKKESEAKSAAETAETMFGDVGKLIEELGPELTKQFPDLAPEVLLNPWVKRGDGVTRGDGVIENRLRLKRNGNENEVHLACQGNKIRVRGATIPSEEAHSAIIREIVEFFAADK